MVALMICPRINHTCAVQDNFQDLDGGWTIFPFTQNALNHKKIWCMLGEEVANAEMSTKLKET